MDYGFCHAILEEEIKGLEARWEKEQAEVKKAYAGFGDLGSAEQYLTAYSKQREKDAWDWVLDMIQKIGERKYLDNSSTSLDGVPGEGKFRNNFSL